MAGETGDSLRFDTCVGLKGLASLVNVKTIGLSFNAHRQIGEQTLEFTDLSLVSAGDHQDALVPAHAASARSRAQLNTVATRSGSGPSQYKRSSGSVPEKRNISQ